MSPPFRRLFFRCKICGGQLVEDTENLEIICSQCGLVHTSMVNAKPMEDLKGALKEPIERDVRRKSKVTKRHAGGRPRSRPYMRLRSFVSKSRAKYVKPIKLKRTSQIDQLLWCIVARAFKRALFERYEVTGVTSENGGYSRRWKGQFLRCPKHKVFHDGSITEFTVDPKHARVRVVLPCGYRLDLKMFCPFCGFQIKPSKKFFRCSNRKGAAYPDRCFCFSMDEVEEVAKREFGEL